MVTVTAARLQPDGWRDWLLWARARERENAATIAMLEQDRGEFLSFAVMAARKLGTAGQ
jgi:hypothetical protein